MKGGTHNRGVDVSRLGQTLQWQCHNAGLSLSRGGLDLSESKQEGSEKERERVTKLHRDCALRAEARRE